MFPEERLPGLPGVQQWSVFLWACGGAETEVQVPPRLQTDEQVEEQGRDDGGGHA